MANEQGKKMAVEVSSRYEDVMAAHTSIESLSSIGLDYLLGGDADIGKFAALYEAILSKVEEKGRLLADLSNAITGIEDIRD